MAHHGINYSLSFLTSDPLNRFCKLGHLVNIQSPNYSKSLEETGLFKKIKFCFFIFLLSDNLVFHITIQ